MLGGERPRYGRAALRISAAEHDPYDHTRLSVVRRVQAQKDPDKKCPKGKPSKPTSDKQIRLKVA